MTDIRKGERKESAGGEEYSRKERLIHPRLGPFFCEDDDDDTAGLTRDKSCCVNNENGLDHDDHFESSFV